MNDRKLFIRELFICVGCDEPIKPGQESWVTVTQARHVVSVPAHDDHREAARAKTLEDKSWQRDQAHYAG